MVRVCRPPGKRITLQLMRHGAATVILGRKADRLAAAAKELEQEAGNGTRCLPAPADVRQFDTLVQAVKKVRLLSSSRRSLGLGCSCRQRGRKTFPPYSYRSS